MATITTAVLSISHDHTKKTATPVVRTSVLFSPIELHQMITHPGRWFKLKCELWAKDTLLGEDGRDDLLYIYNDVYFFSDGNQTALESRIFQVVVGEGLLNEDVGIDEIYAKVRLTNLITSVTITRNSNVVVHSYPAQIGVI
jgi:hypothetical protein